MLLANWQNILEIWSKVFSDLEKTYSMILAKMCWRFGEIVRQYWREPFGDNVGDLEKCGRRGYGDFEL